MYDVRWLICSCDSPPGNVEADAPDLVNSKQDWVSLLSNSGTGYDRQLGSVEPHGQ
jgi:hypothetical protein